jgi:glyoxylase-like metal-dependent hydrolase (beta-lactamase superfamily II)
MSPSDVPPFNFNKEQSLASIERVVELVERHKAQLWIGHDKDVTARINRAPKFYVFYDFGTTESGNDAS